MSAGTISIQNNAAAVAGDGTAFTTELSAGDFIVITTGGVTYTLPVKSVESDTALTLARNYNGPTVAGAAWTAMPRDTLNRISAQIAADTAYAIRQRVLEIDNWYQLLEVNGDVTIKMADGSSYTGPSWLKLIDAMKNPTWALAKGKNLSDLEDRDEAWLNVRPTGATALAAGPENDNDAATKKYVDDKKVDISHGGTGATTASGARTALGVSYGATAGTVAEGNDSRLGTVDGKSGGAISTPITVRGAGLQPKLVASHLDYSPSLGGNAIWIVGMTAAENIMQYVSEVTGQYYSLTTVWRVAGQQQFWSQTSTGRYITPLGELAVQGSDVRIKTDFTQPKSGAWERVEAIGICEFKYNGSDIPQRGFLAQQMGDIDSMYVFTAGKAEDESGTEFDILNVNDRAVMADVIAVIQTLQKKVTDLEKMLASGS